MEILVYWTNLKLLFLPSYITFAFKNWLKQIPTNKHLFYG